jgi:hypothetical protein
VTNYTLKKANDVLWFAARMGYIKNLDHCLMQMCGDDPITLQNVARRLGLFYSFGRDRFFRPVEFMQAFSEDKQANKPHNMDALWMPEVKREIGRLMDEMNAHDLTV